MRGLSLEHLLRVLISAQIVLATMLLGIGDRTAVLTLVSLAMVLVSAYLTDVTGRFSLKQSTANWLALIVVALSVANAFRIDRHGLLIAAANLQSYLQFVLLFQAKTPRVYWQLALLSLGQVAIASTLVPGPTFGVLLLVYVFVGVVAFALLLLHVESKRFQRPTAAAAIVPAAGVSQRLMSRRAPELFSNAAPASSGVIARALVGQAVGIVLLTLGVTAVVFFSLPRWNIPNREVDSSEPLRTVGFSKTVTLGELGGVVNNPNVVMRVEFFHGYGNRPFKLAGEPLFRGTVVTRYEGGQWTQSAPTSPPVPLPVRDKSPFVRQRITIEPLDATELFCACPVFGISQPDAHLCMDADSEQLMRHEVFRNQLLEFEIGTTGIVGDRQLRILPSETQPDSNEIGNLSQIPTGRDSQHDPFAGLRETAARVLREKNLDPADHVAAARALNDFLHTSGQYFYSLDGQPRDETLDPLEDFITKHRRGQCEYFSGALVMMLRSQGIPARMAIGFKGGEWNSVGKYYQVQQLHAHAWVEVLLRKNEIPEGAFDADEMPQAGWLVLDPTEGTQEGNAAAQYAGLVARCRQYIDYAHVLWSNYVVGLNSKRQRQGIYEPLALGTIAAVENLVSPRVWEARFRALGDSSLGTFWQWYRRHWFSWWGGLVAAGFSLLVGSSFLILRRLVRVLRRLGLIGRGRSADGAPVLEMYRRLEAALGGHGLRRHPAQTAYEFALAAGGDLAEKIEHRRIAHLPRRIVESFYRVRFGGRTLDNHEALAVEHALVELEQSLRRPRQT
jgi:transglutaminase-like putative cysteine protease